MTKRPSPFETGISRQLKIHLNNYENDLNAKKNLQETTLQKLLEGAKKLHSIILRNDEIQKVECRRNGTQKCVTNYFTLNGKIINENCRELIRPVEVLNKCSFCDRQSLTYQCAHCLEFFCSSCSFAKYDTFEDSRICISCS